MDLKALIVSSFALTLESLGDVQEKLPELINKTLIHQNSVISLVPESKKQTYFNTYKNEIKELYQEKKKWISKKKNKFYGVRENLQNTFAKLMAEELESKKYSKESLLQLFKDKHMEVLEFNLPEVFFNKDGEYVGGFDVIFGNPPYIQLQKKEIFSDEEKYVYKELGEFKSYEATGDIYALFYERGLNLLKEDGLLGFITSNKFLRAGYGKSLRNYFLENANPLLLVNLGSGMFGATVDTCILIVGKSKNLNMLKAVDLAKRAIEPKARLENMSDYIEQNKNYLSYTKDERWSILTPIEQSIKEKIESTGTPLKNWDISINYGIKTGYNKAFIIDNEKRNEILKNCSDSSEREKTAKLIRPILRGKDIKRYTYKFANLWLIATFPSRHYEIDNYPAIKKYLLSFGKERLEQTGLKHIVNGSKISARKKTNNKWFETQDSINYWNEFFKPKIAFREISNAMDACLVDPGIMLNNKCYLITGEHLKYILSYLNSSIFTKIILPQANATGGKGADFLGTIPLIPPSYEIEQQVLQIYKKRSVDPNQADKDIDHLFCNLYRLTPEECQFIQD
ncbi:MAG: Eco57I restriction-modification methylase domain-containing protein, partial [Lactobacillus equicursoris]|uniref:Eco57I restriction-modification methylase domain-containing protein n=1 Tax=Lactobacillus equicursoris TaxID=420645 RepID=UPI00242C68FE